MVASHLLPRALLTHIALIPTLAISALAVASVVVAVVTAIFVTGFPSQEAQHLVFGLISLDHHEDMKRHRDTVC